MRTLVGIAFGLAVSALGAGVSGCSSDNQQRRRDAFIATAAATDRVHSTRASHENDARVERELGQRQRERDARDLKEEGRRFAQQAERDAAIAKAKAEREQKARDDEEADSWAIGNGVIPDLKAEAQQREKDESNQEAARERLRTTEWRRGALTATLCYELELRSAAQQAPPSNNTAYRAVSPSEIERDPTDVIAESWRSLKPLGGPVKCSDPGVVAIRKCVTDNTAAAYKNPGPWARDWLHATGTVRLDACEQRLLDEHIASESASTATNSPRPDRHHRK